MVDSISGFNSSSAMMPNVGRMQRPDPAKMAEALVTNLDTTNKGYLEVADLQTAFAQGSTANSTTAVQDAAQVFSAFDNNGDGQATTAEITTTLQALADRQQQGTNGAETGGTQESGGLNGPGAPPPPPPPAATTDTSAASTLIDPADTNGDGVVSATEALAALQATQTTTAATNTTTATAATEASAATATTAATTATTETPSTTRTMTDALQRRIMQLMDAYGLQQTAQQTRTGAASTSQSGLSITA